MEIDVLVVQVQPTGELFHMRMDKPYESFLAKIITAVVMSAEDPNESPRSVANIWIERMTEEAYQNIPATSSAHSITKLPSFVTNPT